VPKAYFREDSGMGGGEVGQRPHSNNATPPKIKTKRKKKKKNQIQPRTPKKNFNLRINPNLLVLPLISKMKDHQVAPKIFFKKKTKPYLLKFVNGKNTNNRRPKKKTNFFFYFSNYPFLPTHPPKQTRRRGDHKMT
jgi:hypothetical protein